MNKFYHMLLYLAENVKKITSVYISLPLSNSKNTTVLGRNSNYPIYYIKENQIKS